MKRTSADQSVLSSVFGLNMMCLSSESHADGGRQSFGCNGTADTRMIDSRTSPAIEWNVYQPSKALWTPRGQLSETLLETANGDDHLSQVKSANSSITLRKLSDSYEGFVCDGNRHSGYSWSSATIITSQSTCVWPTGVSIQPDFIENVVTDEEMNLFWNTLKNF